MATKEKKNFVLLQEGKDSNIVFSNAQPRGAALKAANRGHTDIKLRERGTKRVHVFEGKRVQVSAPTKRPKWLPETVWKAVVKKKGVEHV
ncbi:MAG: chromosomal protein MC1 [Myxococcales bacterium]|nr:chromosomal protein MC1 [Myxococcales bacterium]